jgi:beta-lactamase regulating signal transducer with metallopeptidase domain
MKDQLFIVCLALLAFGCANCGMSFLIALGMRWLRIDCLPRARTRRYLLVRAFPAAASGLFIVAFFIPVVCRYEPGGADEQLSFALCALATIGASIVVAAIVRGLRSLGDTRRLLRSWENTARPLALKEFCVSAFVIETAFPVVAVVGIRRPRLYVARKVLENCSTEEFDAILSHERAHIRHSDNLFRLILRCFPDLLAFTSTAARLERGWAHASEEAADDEAVAAGRGLALASALCKVARLARGNSAVAAMAFHGDGDVARRLSRLLRPETRASSASRGRFDRLQFAILLTLPLILASVQVLRVHAVTEALVRLLK